MLKLVLLACLANAYTWPSPQLDALESMRWDQTFSGFVRPCDSFSFDSPNSGRSNAADWLRTAYHDMATHNLADGTGGMDASIRFAEEQARPEDAGSGFANTVRVLIDFTNRYVSIADVLALGAILAVDNCAGPEIPFRGGRVDAGEPNTPGVPEPQQDLDSHIASFARQGFMPTEMIGLVACGHTFGGVQHAPFPDIVLEVSDPDNTESVAHFDSTPVHFDNNIYSATEYISGMTQNPLVVGFNDTTNSDKRIFASDGNVTMNSFANSPELFASTCAELFARMLDTVPKDVQLTEVITPLPVKPSALDLILNGDKLQFYGQVRFWDMEEDPNRTVRMLWSDRLGGSGNATLRPTNVTSSSGGRIAAAWYTFSPCDAVRFLSLDAAAGIASMKFTVNDEVEDQGGLGFAVQDDVIFSASSCFNSTDGPIAGRFDVAVRKGVKPTRVYLEAETRDSVDRPMVVEVKIPPPASGNSNDASTYSIWSIELKTNQTFNAYTVAAEIDGNKATGNGAHSLFDFTPCA
ncbi:heme peroxidase [Mycena capillaripes]|nr:heme peroxidase [Mycena capillaripes]